MGLDQFGNAMTARPTFTWSATAGAVTQTGLFTAPSTSGNVTVTARTGSLSQSAQLTVSGTSFLGLSNPALAGLTQSLFVRDGAITRNDMLQILDFVVQTGSVVNSSEFSSLQTIVGDGSLLKMPNYVQVLAADVVDGNVANAHYQGQSLGYLAAGSSTAQLNELVGKWFLGADHPAAPGYTYRVAAGSLFGSGPAYTDAKQGYLGDCYFVSAMGAIAQSSPSAIQNMIIANGDNTWTVRFYANGVADYVTVDNMLPTDASGTLVYDGQGYAASNAGNKLWLPLLEKAYAEWNETGKEGRDGQNAYPGIVNGFMDAVDAQVLNRTPGVNGLFSNSDEQALIAGLTAGKAVTIGTNANPGYGLYSYHAYMVVGYNSNTGMFTLANPWGFANPGALSWGQLEASCQAFVVADASGTVPAGLPLAASAVDSVFAGMKTG